MRLANINEMSYLFPRAVDCFRGAFKLHTAQAWALRAMSSQVTDRVFMIRPIAFYSNPETAPDNVFQNVAAANSSGQAAALREFDGLVEKLRNADVKVTVFEDTKLPDAIFPNNWISFHSECKESEVGGRNVISVFPMMSPIRRQERRKDIVEHWTKVLGSEVRDYSSCEEKELYLEGTGSMIFDRINNIVYAGLSRRTHSVPLEQFCRDIGSKLVSFRAYSKATDGTQMPIYHTNVMMQICTSFAVICLESIADVAERELVLKTVEGTGKEIIPVSLQQVSNYACNIIQLRGAGGNLILVMSTRAYEAYTSEQLSVFSRHSCSVVHSNLEVVENYGGGSARCMIAEVFPPAQVM